MEWEEVEVEAEELEEVDHLEVIPQEVEVEEATIPMILRDLEIRMMKMKMMM